MPYPSSTRLADLLLQRGDIAARGEMERGRAWGGAVQNIGNIAANSLAGLIQYQQDAPRRELESMELEDRREMVQGRRAMAEENRQIGQLLQGSLTPEGNVDRQRFMTGMKELNLGHRVADLMPLLDRVDPPRRLIERDPTKDLVDPSKGIVVTPGTPKPPEPMNVPVGGAVFDPVTRQPMFTNPRPEEPVRPVELNPGSVLVDPTTGREIAKGQPPREPRQPQSFQWAKDPKTGVVRLMSADEIRSTGAGQPDTADMRNREAGKRTAGRAVEAVKNLGSRIITKVGPAQRMEAIRRGAEAVFGNDPEFRTYQDSRMALAGTLAVEQQGARVSDADVKALWLPMVPDAYRDTAESYALKWDLIDSMRGKAETAPTGGGEFDWDPATNRLVPRGAK